MPEASPPDLGSRAVRNTVVVLAARVVSRLAALVLVIILANHLQPAGYGRYTTLVAYSALVSVLADFGLNTLYTREAARAPDRLPRFLATLLAGKVPLLALAFFVFAIALGRAGLGSLAIPGAALLGATTYANLLRNTFYAVGRLEFEAVAILAETAIQAGLILAGVSTGQGVAYFLWAYAASYGFTCLYCLAVIPLFKLATSAPAVDARLLTEWLRVAFPFALGSFLTNLYFKVDVPILQALRPIREVGWYQFAYKPFEALQFIPLAVQTVIYPVLAVYYRQSRDRVDRTYREFFRVLVLLGWPLTVGTVVLAHPVGHLFRLFPESIPALRILALAIVFLFANSAFTAMLYSVDRQDLFAWTTAVAVAVNVALNLALIPRFGYLAASADTVVTEAAFSAVAWWFVRRTGHGLPWLNLSWRILLAGGAMGAVAYPLAGRSLLISLPAAVLAYGLALWLLRAVTPQEVRLLARGLRLRR